MPSNAGRDGNQRRLAGVIVLVVVLLGVGASFLFVRGGEHTAASAPEHAPLKTESPAPVELSDVAPRREATEHGDVSVRARAVVDDAATPAEVSVLRGIVIGHAVDANGAPVVGVSIEAWPGSELEALEVDHGDGSNLRAVAAATTDVAGGFSFELPPGEYAFSFGEGRFPVPALGARKIVAGTQRLDVQLPALGELEITILDDGGRVAPNIALRGWSDGTGHLTLHTDNFGRATARHLPAGEFRVLANDPELGRGDLAIVIAPGTTTRIEIPLRRRGGG